MNKLIKYIAAAIIIFILGLSLIAGWKVTENIRQSFRKDLQDSFKESLCEYGKNKS